MKKFIVSVSMAALLVTPVLAFADTATDRLIAQLQAQIVVLQTQLNTLLQQQLSQAPVAQTTVGGGIDGAAIKNNIGFGSRGSDVTVLQNTLKDAGVYFGPVTGYFGVLTREAVKNIQISYGISSTGFVGILTRNFLNTVISPKLTFSASPTAGGAPLAVMFYSNGQKGTVNFGDGTPSTSLECDNISAANSSSVSSACLRTFTRHTYTAPGIYTATLQALPQCTVYVGQTDSSNCKPVTIGNVTITVTGGTAQPLTVISPNGGEQWQKGTTQNIKWSAPSSVSSVSISLEPWYACLYTYPSCAIAVRPYTLTASTQNDGVFEWTVGKDSSGVDIPAGQYTVTVGNESLSDSSDKPFSIVAPSTIVAPTISSLQPTSGPVGTSVTITGTGFILNKTGSSCSDYDCAPYSWPTNTVNFGPVTISNVQSYDGKTLDFQVPSQYMPPCPVGMGCAQVMSQVGPGIYNVSVSNANGTSNTVNFTVTSKTEALSINPTSAGIKVGGSTEFQALFDNCPSGAQCFVGPLPVRAVWTSSNPKVASVAYKEIPCPAGSSCFVQQFDYLTAVVTGISLGSATITADYTDSSGAVFTASAPVLTIMAVFSPLQVLSPNGGEQWQKGTTQNIKWSAPSSVSSVSISLEPWYACLYTYPSCAIAVRPYTLTASTQNDGVFEWTVGKDSSGVDIPAGQYTVTVGNESLSDSSDKPFSIVALGTIVAPTIFSLQPTSGPVGTSVTITGTGFTATNNSVKFGGGYLNGISSNGTAITFTVPDGLTPCPPGGTVCPMSMSYMQVTPDTYSVSVINANGTSNTVNFTVTSKTEALSINPTSAGIKVGGSTEFQALFDNCPSGAQCFVGPLPVRAVWTSSNPKVASVAYKEIPCPAGSSCFVQQFDYLTAVVTGISLGSATITADYTDSSGAVFTASAVVTTVMP